MAVAVPIEDRLAEPRSRSDYGDVVFRVIHTAIEIENIFRSKTLQATGGGYEIVHQNNAFARQLEAGGEGGGLVDMAILAEEFYSVNASVTLTMLGTVLGLLPILLGGTSEQCRRLLAPFAHLQAF